MDGLIKAAREGDEEAAREALEAGRPPGTVAMALQEAAGWGHLGCVKLLMRECEPSDYADALRAALRGGRDECVQALMEQTDLGGAVGVEALECAANFGRERWVKALMETVDPRANHSRALWAAAASGHAGCVKLLLPVSDPRANRSGALRTAAHQGHAQCVRLLLPVSDPLDNPQGIDAAGWARQRGFEALALEIEAFVQAGQLEGVVSRAPSKRKSSL